MTNHSNISPMGAKTERIDEWSSTDSIALAAIYRRLVEELKRYRPPLRRDTIDGAAMSAHEMAGYDKALDEIANLAVDRPIANADADYKDMSTNSDNEQNPLN